MIESEYGAGKYMLKHYARLRYKRKSLFCATNWLSVVLSTHDVTHVQLLLASRTMQSE